jgi:hypothetical protein
MVLEMDRYDYETLKDCLKRSNWEHSHDTVMAVGKILFDERALDTYDMIFNYFDKPWHYEPEIRELVIEWELELVGKDIEHLTTKEAEIAINWLDHYGFDSKVIDTLTESLDERYILCGYAPCGVK